MYHTDETHFYQPDDSKVIGRFLKEKSKLTFADVLIKIFIACQDQSFFLQTLLFVATVQKIICTYALVST